MTATEKFQPYYIAYAKAGGRTPESQLAHDKVRWPGGCMCGFILWISANKTVFRKKNPSAFMGDSIRDFTAWGEFLKSSKINPATL